MDDEENKQTEEGKSNSKKVAKKMGKRILRAASPYIVILLICLMIASATFSVLTSVIDLVKGIGQSIVNLFTVGENGIEVSDEQIDKIIETIESSGLDLDDLGLLR